VNRMVRRAGSSGDLEVGAKVRAIRQAKHWTLKELAAQSGFDPPNLSKLENGQLGFSADSIRRLASALGVSVADLFSSGAYSPVSWIPFRAEPKRPALPTLRNVSEHTFALEVSDDALAPLICSRDIVICEPALPLNMGRTVVARHGKNLIVRKVRMLKAAIFSGPVKKNDEGGESEEWTLEEDALFEIYADSTLVPPMKAMEAKVVAGSSCHILGPVVERITNMYSGPTL
jgi:transcriptional regulator with XRE-family HTH domain